MTAAKLDSLSLEDLVLRVDDVLAKGHRLTGQLLLLLLKIEDQREELEGAYPSMLELCIRRFGMSEGKACRHLAAARLVRDCPKLLRYIENGDIHLSRVSQLRHVLRPDNVDDLVAATRGKSKAEVAELIRCGEPRRNVRGTMRKLPTFRTDAELAPAARRSKAPIESQVESRYRLQMTISRALRDKVERALDLTSHGNPDRDLTVLLERAVDMLLDRAEKQQLGEPARPDADASTPTPAIEPSDIRQSGSRTKTKKTSAKRLEVDDVIVRADGGSDGEDDVRAARRAHEGVRTDETAGKEHVRPVTRSRQRSAANGGRQRRPPMQADVTSRRASSARAAGRASASSSRGASSESAAS